MSLSSHIDPGLEPPTNLADRVIRRAQVSHMTRALQSSLALANVKIKHGWESLSIDTLEPRIAQELQRKRPVSSQGTTSSSASSTSGDNMSCSNRGDRNALVSSPLTAPMFSDDVELDLPDSGRSYKRRRVNHQPFAHAHAHPRLPASSNQLGRKSRSAAAMRSWKRSHHLPESSPAPRMQCSANASFLSTTSALEAPVSPLLSEEDESDLPVVSTTYTLQTSSVLTASSPPRTPPQERRMIHKGANISWSRTPRNGEEGADLLMYLATSPTPALTATRAHTSSNIPSTPPSVPHPLGYTGLFNMPNTPSTNVNFADFCNVTPSPARNQWPKTPATAILRTPQATNSAKRRFGVDIMAASFPAPSPTADRAL